MKKRMALAALLVSGAAAFADCGWEFALGEGAVMSAAWSWGARVRHD